MGGYTVGVLVQTNFGGVLRIGGASIGKKLNKYTFQKNSYESADGSCMIVIITDAPLDSRNLKRLAKRGMMGLAKTGGIASNGSGDYVIALSVANQNLINAKSESFLYKPTYLFNKDGKNKAISGYKTSIVIANIWSKINGVTPLKMSKRLIWGGATLLI